MVDEKIISIISKMLEEEDAECNITGDMKLCDLALNSVSYIKAVVEIEKEFGIEFDDDDLDIENFETVNDFIEVVKELL